MDQGSRIINRGRRAVAERSVRHEPGEDLEHQPARDNRGIILRQALCLLGRGPEDRDAAKRLGGLAGERAVDEDVSRLAQPGPECKVALLQGVQLRLGQLRGVRGPAQKHHRIGVELHGVRLSP